MSDGGTFPCSLTKLLSPVARRRYTVRPKPQQLALNCNSSLVALIDAAGVLTVQDLEAKVPNGEERKSLSAPRQPSPVRCQAYRAVFIQ